MLGGVTGFNKGTIQMSGSSITASIMTTDSIKDSVTLTDAAVDKNKGNLSADSNPVNWSYNNGFLLENATYQNTNTKISANRLNLKMTDKDVCPFLKEKRCSIHSFRPGICRVFPLGRIYEENRLDYFLQVEGCVKENRSKVKVCKWLDTPELKKNQQYLIDWHAFRKKIECILGEMSDENQKKTITMFLLNTFYINPYDTEQDFYLQFYARLDRIAQVIA